MDSSEVKVIKVNKIENIRKSESIEEIRLFLENTLMMFSEGPSAISVTSKVGERTTQFFVDCPKEDMGRIIGSGGKNIGAIRTLIGNLSAKKGFRAVVEIPFYPKD